jgi:hypothetical protein
MRKLILAFLIVAVLISGGVYYFSRKAPELLRLSIARAINKTVKIEAIEYHFPWTFELRGFQILETRVPFVDEVCFSVDKVLLHVSPLSISQNQLILDDVDVSQALVVVRMRDGKLYHALSGAMSDRAAPVPAGPPRSAAGASQIPLKIRRFHLQKSRFQFVDYDVQSTGFVIELDQIEASFKDISFPFSSNKTEYHLDARMSQGRQQYQASFNLNGWTRFGNYETDAMVNVSDVSLPYFKPYYSQVTSAQIEEGRFSSRLALTIRDEILTANADLELSDLYFRSYEDGNELFGLKAEEILSFLKDSAGKLKFQIVIQWNIRDGGVQKRERIRDAIEKSLKKTLLVNVGNILEKTIKTFSDGGLDQAKDDFEGTLKKVKKLFR